MPLKVKDADGAVQYLKTGAGDGSLGNPFEYAFALDTAVDTELPAAAALADATANPTVPLVGACMHILNPVSGNWYRWSSPAADGSATTSFGGITNLLFNGATWDRRRNNQSLPLLVSAARTATLASADQINYNHSRLLLIVNVSVVGTGSITPSLQVKDSISGNYFTVWTAAAAIVTAAMFTYYFADGATGGSYTEKVASQIAGRTWRLNMVHNNANTITYSASAEQTV
jgi:hypothetical protein